MKKQILLLAVISSLFFLSKVSNAQSPDWLWAMRAGGMNNDLANSVAVDASGNTCITGYFQSNTISFGSTTLTNVGSNDIFLTKYNSNGNVLWAKKAGGYGEDRATSVAVDASGNIYIAGYFESSTITFGSTTLTNNTTNGYADIFLVKYNTNGDVLWAKSAGGTSLDCANSVIVDSSGFIYMAGFFTSSSLTIGSTILSNAGGYDIFYAKYDTSGNLQWARSAGGSGDDKAKSIAVDALGNIYMTGFFTTFTFLTLSNGGSNDIFLLKFDTDGNFLWAKSANGTYNDYANSVTLDSSGNIYVTGYFTSSTLIFGSTTLSNAGSVGTSDIFLAKYDVDGNVLWAKKAGSTGNDEANSIAADTFGNIYIAGWFDSPSFNFGSTTLTNAGMGDIFLSKYNAYGNVLWAKSAGDMNYDYAYSIVSNASGDIYTVGGFASYNLTFGSYILSNASGYDIYIAKCSGCNPLANAGLISGVTTVCQGQNSVIYSVPTITNATSYIWTLPNGATGTSNTNSIMVNFGVTAIAGNITVKGHNACYDGVSSTLAIILNSLPESSDPITGTATVCQGQNSLTYTVPAIANATSYIWNLPNGATGTSSTNSITISYGTMAVSGNITVKGHNGCGDGAASTLSITVNPLPVSAGIISGFVTVCQGQNSVTYTVPTIANATTYVWTLPTGATGTSSTNSITVNYGTSATSGNITVKGNNSCGDGAISTLAITVNQGYTFTENHSMCNGDIYNWHGTNCTTANTYTANYNSINGCDSIYTLHLTVNPNYSFTENHSVCNGNSFNWHGINYNTAGSYTDSLNSINGCDSIYTLNLIVDTVDIGVTLSGITITADSAADAFQWLNCNNAFAIIPNEIYQNFTASANGNYAVKVTQGACADTSACIQITTVGLSSVKDDNIKIYPNPVTNKLIIEITGNKETVNFEILNSIGQLVFKGSLLEKTVIQTTKFANGVYFIKLENEKMFEFKKIVKE